MKPKRPRGRPRNGASVEYGESAVAQLRKVTGFDQREAFGAAVGIHPEAIRAMESRGDRNNRGVQRPKAVAIGIATGASAKGLMNNQLFPEGRPDDKYTVKDYRRREVIMENCRKMGRPCAAKLGEEITAFLAREGEREAPHSMLLLGRIALAIDRVHKDFCGDLRKKESLMHRLVTYLEGELEARNESKVTVATWLNVMKGLQAASQEDSGS